MLFSGSFAPDDLNENNYASITWRVNPKAGYPTERECTVYRTLQLQNLDDSEVILYRDIELVLRRQKHAVLVGDKEQPRGYNHQITEETPITAEMIDELHEEFCQQYAINGDFEFEIIEQL